MKISALGLDDRIQMTTEFLPDDESFALLARADLLVFPYQDTGESSSAAVRNGLATGRPVAVTPLPILFRSSPPTASAQKAAGIPALPFTDHLLLPAAWARFWQKPTGLLKR
jgi:glycosyltransferase involved in cell wall biosynthesis